MISPDTARDRASRLVELAIRAGADAADAVASGSASESVGVRLGVLEDVERSEDESIGIRVFVSRWLAVFGEIRNYMYLERYENLDVALGDSGDRVIIKRGSWFTTTMSESELDAFEMQLVVQYIRRGELFLEGECQEARFDFRSGELDFLGRLTLKQDIEKNLGQSGYALALVRDVTQLEVEVRQNRLVRLGGDLTVQLREGVAEWWQVAFRG